MTTLRGNGARPTRSAIEKVVAVTEALGQQHRLSEIARQRGLPTSTVHRILRELVAVGWVRVDEEGEYRLGARLLSLVQRSSNGAEIVRLAQPILRALCERTSHTVHLAIRHGDEAVYVGKLDGRRSYQMRSRIGLSFSLHSTAIGKALLARLSDSEVRSIATRTGLPARTEHTITDVRLLLAQLATIRRRGFALDDEENEPHTRCIGAAILDHADLPIGGLSLSSLVFDLDGREVRRLAPLVVGAAQEVSAALGAGAAARR